MATTISYNDLIIDRIDRIIFENAEHEILGGLNDVQNFSISHSSETKDKVDSTGALIKRFYQAKAAEFSGENATFNLGLAALQYGGEVEYAGTGDDALTIPYVGQFTVASGTTTITLPFTPKAGTISVVDTDSSLLPNGTQYEQAASASATKFSLDGTTLTVPTGYVGTLQIAFERTVTEDAAIAKNYSDRFPDTCRMTVSVIGCNKCDKETLIHFYIVFPSAQMSSDFDLSMTTDGTHNFSGVAQVDSCSPDKLLYYIAIPSDDEV